MSWSVTEPATWRDTVLGHMAGFPSVDADTLTLRSTSPIRLSSSPSASNDGADSDTPARHGAKESLQRDVSRPNHGFS